MLDRSTFVKPLAHRGLYGPDLGLIENTGPAIEAALSRGSGIECDLRPASDGTPFVFHDATLDRLTDTAGPISALAPSALAKVRHREADVPILTFGDLLALANGRGPLMIEIKSEWDPPDRAFLGKIAALAAAYRGPILVTSFDPAVLTIMAELAPGVPRGVISGSFEDGSGWWRDKIDEERAYRLRHLLESGPVKPACYAYHLPALPTPVTRFVREVLGLPIYAWTVKTPEELARSQMHADAPIFSGFIP